MRKQSLSIISVFMISTALLTGCGDTAPVPDTATPETTEASETATPDTKTDTPTEEVQQAISQLDWTELGLLETNPNLREAFETIFKTTGETGNKEGIIYETPTSSTDTTYTYDNNNTLAVALHNYNFRSLYDSKSTEIADTARNNYLDLDEEDDSVCVSDGTLWEVQTAR